MYGGCHTVTHLRPTEAVVTGGRLTHLSRRGAIYRVRFRLPADLAKQLNAVDISRSLSTPDHMLARQRARAASVWFGEIVERLRNMADITRADLDHAADAFFAKLLGEAKAPPEPVDEVWPDQEELRAESARQRMGWLNDRLHDEDFDWSIEDKADRIARRAGARLAELSPDLKQAALQLAAEVELEVQRFVLHTLSRPREPFVFSRWAPMEPPPAAALEPGQGHQLAPTVMARPQDAPRTIAEMVGLYLAFRLREEISQSHHDEMRRALDWLSEALGPDSNLASVTPEDARKVRDGFQRLDIRQRGRRVPFLKRQTENSDHWIAPQTSARYWHTVQAFFAWLRDEKYISTDPADRMRAPKRANRPPATPDPFTDDEVQAFLSLPLFAGRKSRGVVLKSGNFVERGSHWWAAIISLHSGMRAGEIAQLEVKDVDLDAEVAVFHVRREDHEGKKTKQVKNVTSERSVPVAPVLISLGLPAFVQLRSKATGSEAAFS